MSDTRFGLLTDAAASFVLVGGRVIDPGDGIDTVRDVAVRDGVIVQAADDAERIDARGLFVTPGFCDLHTHLREPGSSGAETISSGSRAAAHGGFTTVCAMPNTDPSLDSAEALAAVMSARASCRVRVVAAASRGRAGVEPTDLASVARAGAVGVSDDGAAVSDSLVPGLLEQLAPVGLPLFEHAEDAAIAAEGVMCAGGTASRLGLAPWPAHAEVAIVERDIALAEAAGARLHLTHLSTAAALDAVRAARSRGVAVTCDVTPHHLAMTDAWVAGSRRFSWEEPESSPRPELAYDGRCRVNPPLASRADALVLLAGLDDGTVDAIATDHAPHPPQTKLVPFDAAAPGLIGLETALSIGLLAVEADRLRLATLIAALSTRPAAIIGETRGLRAGDRADLVAFDPAARWTVERSTLASASVNTPLIGMELPGVVRLTVADGRVTYRS